jgi:hypothetical protein
MTGREEFARQHPELAKELDRIGQRAVFAVARWDVHAAGQVDTDAIVGGLPVAAGFGVVVAGITEWSWSLWLILPAILLGMGVLASAVETLKWVALFGSRVAARSVWLRGTGPTRRGRR